MAIFETTREDGLHIVTWQVPSLKRVHMSIVAGVGSAYDPPGMDGLLHYFEHMAFKGTAKRTASDIQSFRQRNLLLWNAGTGSTTTRYEAEAVPSKLRLLCDILCDFYFYSLFPEEEIEREKGVIIQEIARCKDNDHLTAQSALRERLWFHNPRRKFGVGTPEGVGKVTRDVLISAKEQWYVPANTTIFVIGNVSCQECCDYINAQIPLSYASVKHQAWSDEYDVAPHPHAAA